MLGIISIAILCLSGLLIYLYTKPSAKKNIHLQQVFPEAWKKILNERVLFYTQLDQAKKEKFEHRIQQFLADVAIQGVELEVDDQLRLLVAASAVIPVFYFEQWYYVNLAEVLVYNGLVETYQISEADEHNTILGQVRPFQNKHILLLSKPALEAGFDKVNGKENVGFHEFVHLIDGADGETDGLPRALMAPELIQPWSHLMYKEIERIEKGQSDINPYGLTNHAEFFAVVCEYFFENPEKFKKEHAELYTMLNEVFLKNV